MHDQPEDRMSYVSDNTSFLCTLPGAEKVWRIPSPLGSATMGARTVHNSPVSWVKGDGLSGCWRARRMSHPRPHTTLRPFVAWPSDKCFETASTQKLHRVTIPSTRACRLGKGTSDRRDHVAYKGRFVRTCLSEDSSMEQAERAYSEATPFNGDRRGCLSDLPLQGVRCLSLDLPIRCAA